MDINQLIEQAKQRGLSAIDSIKKTVTPTPQPQQPQMSRYVPMSVAPKITNFNSVVSTTSFINKPVFEPVVKPVVEPLKFQAYPGAKVTVAKPTVTPITGPGYVQNTGKLWNDFTNTVSSKLIPAIQETIKTGNVPGTTLTPGSQAFSESFAREIKIAQEPQKAAEIRSAQGQTTVAGLESALKGVSIPTQAFTNTYVVPAYLNYQLNKRAEEKGIAPTVEERTKAANAELTTNEIQGNKEGTREYLLGELSDLAIQFIDPGLIMSGGGFLLKKVPAGVTALRAVNRLDKLEEISKLALKGEGTKIESIIGRKLTPAEVVKIETVSKDLNAVNVLTDIEKTPKVTKIQDVLTDAEKISNEMTAARELAQGKTKKPLGEKLKNWWTTYKTLTETSAEEMFNTIGKIEKKLGSELQPSKNPLMFLDVLYKSSKQAEIYAKENGLFDIIAEASKLSNQRTSEEFGNFLEARRLLTLQREAKYKLTNPEKTQILYESFLPKYQELATKYDAYMNNLINDAYAGGLIDAEELKRVTDLKDYTPLYKIRNLEEAPDTNILTKRTIGTVSDPKVIQQLQQLEEKVSKNPMESSLYLTYRVKDQLNKNKYASLVGDLIKEGKIEGASMIRTAENVKQRKLVLNDINEVKKVKEKVQKTLSKNLKKESEIYRENQKLSKEGYNLFIETRQKPTQSAYGMEGGKVIRQADDLGKGLTFEDKKYQAAYEKLVKSKSALIKTLSKELKEDVAPLVNKFTQNARDMKLSPKEMDAYIANITDDQIAILMNEVVNLPYGKYKNFYNKVIKKNSELTQAFQDLQNVRDRKALNDVVNSLIYKTPDQLVEIQNKLSANDQIHKQVIIDILKTQEKLDETTGYLKSLKDSEKALRDASSNNKTTISWYKDGVKEIAIVPKDLAESFNVTTDSDMFAAAVDLLNVPTRIWKNLTVGINPVSQLRQLVKDQTALFFFTEPRVKLSVLNPANFTKAMFNVSMETPEYYNWVKLGGGGTSYDVFGGADNVSKFIKEGGKTKWYSINNFEKKLAKLEQASRFELYDINKRHYLRQGYSPKDAELKAIYDSNNILPNYFQKGKLQKVQELVSPFVTAKIKAGRSLRQNFAKKPVQTTLYVLTNIALPTSIATYWNMSSPERREAYKDIPEYEKKRGIIILPENPVKDENDKWIYTSIPMEESIWGLSGAYRRSTEYAMDTNEQSVSNVFSRFFSGESVNKANLPLAGSEITQSLTGQNIPVSSDQLIRENLGAVNPLIRGAFELGTGYNLFKNSSIETQVEKNRLPKDRFDDKTTLLAKDIGNKYNVSPKLVDHFIQTYFPGIGQFAQYGIDTVRTNLSSDPRTVVGKNPIQELEKIFVRSAGGQKALDINKQITQDKQEEASFKMLVKEAIKNNDTQLLNQMAPNLTYQEFRALETSVQEDAIRNNLSAEQKNLYNLTPEEQKKVLQKNPELASVFQEVNTAKQQVKSAQNMDVANLNFKAATTGTTTAGRAKMPVTAKLKTARGTKGPKAPKVKAPTIKKVKAVKPKKLKAVRFAKVKPLKKVKRL